jgi:DNA repair ATPase RecN
MSENVQTAMFEILKSIQAKLVEHDQRFDAVEKRFDEMGDLVRKHRRDTAGLMVMAKGAAGQFAEDLAAVEERVRVLEARGR